MSGTRRFGWQQSVLGEHVAEFLGTMIIILLGNGVVAMAVAALNQSGRGEAIFLASGDWLLICWGWGFAVCFAVYVAGGVSGAHLNPAVTLALAWRRGFAWNKVPGYIVAQVLGAFVGAAIIYANYRYAIVSYETANDIVRDQASGAGTFGIFGTTPAPYYENWFGPFLDQVIGTAILVAFIFAVTDDYNTPVKANLAPLIVGFIVVAIGMSFGANAGYAINPARDFGPRFFAWIAGWGENAMPGNYANIDFYLWIPIVGPIVGGLLGAGIYDFLVRNVLIARGQKPDLDVHEEGSTAVDE